MKPSDLMRRYESTLGSLRGRRGDIWVVLSTLRKFSAGPQAARTDGQGRANTIICDEHLVDLSDCHRADRHQCTGSPDSSPADPTFSAVDRGDRFRQLEDELITLIERMAKDSARLNDIVAAHLTVTREEAKDKGDPGCEWHQRIGSWVPVLYEACTIPGSPRPLALCSACYQRARRVQRVLTRAEVEHHRTHGRWPREKDPKTGEERPPAYSPDRPLEPNDGRDILERLNAGHPQNDQWRAEQAAEATG